MKHPLMRNNITRGDLDKVISHLQQTDPILTQNKHVRHFEEQWSEWLGVKHSVFVNSGSSANLLSLAALQIDYPQGGEVIVSPFGWVSDVAAVLHTGFTPRFVDINPHSLAMDSRLIIDALTENTRAVLLVHAQGFNGLTQELLDELDKRSIPLIEDVCESHGAQFAGKKLGSFGQSSNFSFYYAHHMSTIEGGMVCTNDEQLYDRFRLLRSHGLVRESCSLETKGRYASTYADLNPEFIFAFPAYNVRNTEIGGILGCSQLERIDEVVEKRNQNCFQFLELIDSAQYQTDFLLNGMSNYAFNLILKEPDVQLRDRVMKCLTEHGIEFRRGSAGGGNQIRQPYLKSLELDPKNFPVLDHVHFFGFYIGNYPDLSSEEISWLCNVINNA